MPVISYKDKTKVQNFIQGFSENNVKKIQNLLNKNGEKIGIDNKSIEEITHIIDFETPISYIEKLLSKKNKNFIKKRTLIITKKQCNYRWTSQMAYKYDI